MWPINGLCSFSATLSFRYVAGARKRDSASLRIARSVQVARPRSGRMVGHPEVGTHGEWASVDSFGGCWSDKEFESTPGSLSSGDNPEETSEMVVMKSIR